MKRMDTVEDNGEIMIKLESPPLQEQPQNQVKEAPNIKEVTFKNEKSSRHKSQPQRSPETSENEELGASVGIYGQNITQSI